MKPRPLTLLPLLGVVFACNPAESSDLDQYKLQIDLVDQLGLDSHRVLVGTTFSLSMEGVTGGGFYDLSCVATSATGVVSKIGSDGFSIDAAGPGTVEFAAPDASCPYLAEFMPDRWSAIGVEPNAATALWVPAGDSAVRSSHGSPGPAGTFPEAIGRPLDHARVAADGRFVLLPTLIDQSAGERVEIRWRDLDAVLTVPDEHKWTTMAMGGNMLDGRLPAGESFAAIITMVDNQFDLPHVEAVPLDEIVDLQLIPVYVPSHEPEREWGVPAGVIAIALDADGHRILGAPIEWSVTRGYIQAAGDSPYAELFGDDVVQISDCGDPPMQPEWRSARMEAKVAGHVASAELEWLALPDDLDLDPDDTCHSDSAGDDGRSGSGCDCSATASSRGAELAAWPLLVLAIIRRRRRSTSK